MWFVELDGRDSALVPVPGAFDVSAAMGAGVGKSVAGAAISAAECIFRNVLAKIEEE